MYTDAEKRVKDEIKKKEDEEKKRKAEEDKKKKAEEEEAKKKANENVTMADANTASPTIPEKKDDINMDVD